MDINNVKWGWNRQKPDARDFKFKGVYPGALPTSVDLSGKHQILVVDQKNLGACTANGIAGALDYLQLEEGLVIGRYPSRLFIYYNERVIEGTVDQDAGANIRDGIKSVASQGYCAETDWPYDVSQFTVQPPTQAYTDASKDLVKSYQAVNVDVTSVMDALALGFPVIVGFEVYDSFMAATDGNIPMPDMNNESLQGGHCVLVVGYDQSTKRFKFQNSWGTRWGYNGYGTLPFAYLGNPSLASDFWIVTADESVSVVPSPDPNPTPPSPSGGCNPFKAGFWRRILGGDKG